MDWTHAKTGKHAVAVGIFAHCFMLHFRSRRGVSKKLAGWRCGVMEFQTNLKKLRTEEGLTQDQLALLVETSTDTIGRIERKQKIASYEVLFRIARYFDKPVEDVFWYE